MAISTINQNGLNAPLTLTSPVLTTPNLGTPSALVLTNATGTPAAINLANATALPRTAMPTGSVIQTVTGTTSLFATSSGGVQVTMLEVTITPTSTTSKIIFMYSNSYCDNQGSSQDGLIYLRRGGSSGTVITNGSTGYSNYFWSAARIQVPVQGTFVDSPASTSSQTYGVYLKNSTGTCSMSGCEIVLMEVVS